MFMFIKVHSYNILFCSSKTIVVTQVLNVNKHGQYISNYTNVYFEIPCLCGKKHILYI